MENRRANRRINVHFHAVFEQGPRKVEGTVSQISDSGLLFSTGTPLEMKSKGALRFDVFENEPAFEIAGEIIYLDKANEASKTGHPAYGLRFIELNDAKRDEIEKMMVFFTMKDRCKPKTEYISGKG